MVSPELHVCQHDLLISLNRVCRGHSREQSKGATPAYDTRRLLLSFFPIRAGRKGVDWAPLRDPKRASLFPRAHPHPGVGADRSVHGNTNRKQETAPLASPTTSVIPSEPALASRDKGLLSAARSPDTIRFPGPTPSPCRPQTRTRLARLPSPPRLEHSSHVADSVRTSWPLFRFHTFTVRSEDAETPSAICRHRQRIDRIASGPPACAAPDRFPGPTPSACHRQSRTRLARPPSPPRHRQNLSGPPASAAPGRFSGPTPSACGPQTRTRHARPPSPPRQ